MTSKEKNISNLEHYGILHQIPIWIEEMSELTKELCKWQRHYEEWNGCMPFLNLNNIKLETTDVQVCLDQIKEAVAYSPEQQEMDYEFKVERQRKRIEDEKTKH
jgi:hypothetical protein